MSSKKLLHLLNEFGISKVSDIVIWVMSHSEINKYLYISLIYQYDRGI